MNRYLRHAMWIFIGLAILGILAAFRAGHGKKLAWEPYAPEKLAAAKAAGKPVILDFYADWCAPCRKLERSTLSDPDVMRALQNLVRIKVDLTRSNSPGSLNLQREFAIEGIPTIILLGPDGREIPDTRILGFVPAEAFLAQTRLR